MTLTKPLFDRTYPHRWAVATVFLDTLEGHAHYGEHSFLNEATALEALKENQGASHRVLPPWVFWGGLTTSMYRPRMYSYKWLMYFSYELDPGRGGFSEPRPFNSERAAHLAAVKAVRRPYRGMKVTAACALPPVGSGATPYIVDFNKLGRR